MDSFNLAADRRDHYLELMSAEELDLLVIGGGITGAGIAWDASMRGMRTGLIEMKDFASGTSSRSTKLVHGGLRYLKQGEFKLVREVGLERKLLHERLPHLVERLPMLLPIYKGGTYGYYTSSLGIAVYDWLAGVGQEDRRRMFRRKQTMELEPLLQTEGLKGAGLYVEYRTDDARLTIEIIKTAAMNGALICNYAQAVDFIYKSGKAAGVNVKDEISGRTYALHAKKIINAAGPWVDHLRRRDQSLNHKRLRLTKGVHLVFAHERLPIRQAVYFDAPDGRMIFAIPRSGKTYIGTTDTVHEGDPANPAVTAADADYLIDAVNSKFPTVRLQVSDIESAYAGYRPLIHEAGKSPSEISRKDEIFVSPSGLISIAGGKLTGFRKMAEKAVNLAAQYLEDETGVIYPPCTTDRTPISGGVATDGTLYEAVRERLMEESAKLGIAADEANSLLSRYGANTGLILRFYEDMEDAAGSVSERLLAAESRYSVEYEMAVHAVDYLLRRTGWMLFDRSRAERLSGDVIRYMGQYLGWDEARFTAEWSLLNREWSYHAIQEQEEIPSHL